MAAFGTYVATLKNAGTAWRWAENALFAIP